MSNYIDISGYYKMDFYGRVVWARDPTCECYMMNLASNLWFLTRAISRLELATTKYYLQGWDNVF